MRRALFSAVLAGLALFVALPDVSHAQEPRPGQGEGPEGGERPERPRAPAPLNERVNAGPCPIVRILYDAARTVEFEEGRLTAAAVGFTGEIEGVSADCVYREADPIVMDIDILFNLGRGPTAEGGQRTYRYWVAVTERNRAVLAKEYFEFTVDFDGADRARVTEELRGLVIPRRDLTVSGGNFEVLVGFDVTPEMAEFNRSGSRFRIDAGVPAGE